MIKRIEMALRIKKLQKQGKVFLTAEGMKLVDKIAKVKH